MERFDRFLSDIKGKKLAFIGAGVSHLDCIRMFAEKGFAVTVRDKNSREKMGPVADELQRLGVRLVLGEDYLKDIDDDIVFRTPGMRFTDEDLEAARRRDIIVTSEMELFFALCPCRIIGVTGSDGKTTSTSIIAAFMKEQGYTVHLGGNIGRALLPIIEQVKPDDWAVVELSSFQLISMRHSPDIALITNVAPNHLDMHRDMEEYVDAKRNLYAHQDAFSKTVLNAHNAITRSFSPDVRGKLYFFDRFEPVEKGAYLDRDGNICMRTPQGEQKLFHKSEIKIPGEHNVENYLGAIATVWGLVEPEVMRHVANTFAGVEHRIELVRELDGVKYYNDSIGTSPSRTVACLESFPEPVILIAGGYDKGIPFHALALEIRERVKTLVLTGDTARAIRQAVEEAEGGRGCPEIIQTEDLAGAVEAAPRAAGPGDVVVLSPACAAFDRF